MVGSPKAHNNAMLSDKFGMLSEFAAKLGVRSQVFL